MATTLRLIGASEAAASEGAEGGESSPRKAIGEVREQLLSAFVERDREIEALLLAAIAGEHLLLLGPPGTAKSALARVFSGVLGAQYFERLLTRFSVPEELFGPVKLSALKEDRYERSGKGQLQEAEVAFLDEIFKANSAILNSLLGVANERLFEGARVPLRMLVGASNELPEDSALAALFDRFMLRCWTDYASGPESFERLLFGAEPTIAAKLDLAVLDAAQAEARAIPIARSVAEALWALRAALAQEGITISDRRWKRCLGLMRAAAYLDGAAEVTRAQIDVLADALWQTPEQRARVTALCLQHAAPEIAKAQEIHDAVSELAAGLPAAETATEAFLAKAPAVSAELKRAGEKIGEIERGCTGRTAARIARLRLALDATRAKIKAEATARI